MCALMLSADVVIPERSLMSTSLIIWRPRVKPQREVSSLLFCRQEAVEQVLVNYERSDDDPLLFQLIKLTITRSTSEERQYIITDMRCQMMSRNQLFWSVAFHIQDDDVQKMRLLFNQCLLPCVTQKQLLLEFEMCNVIFVSTMVKNISEGRRSRTCILEFLSKKNHWWSCQTLFLYTLSR